MMIQCVHCGQQVWPTPEGACPSCRQSLPDAREPVMAEVVEERPAPHERAAAAVVPGLADANVNPYQAPRISGLGPIPATGPTTTSGLWRQGTLLVVQHGARLPDRCVKSNEPAGGKRLKRSLAWHHPAIYISLLAGVLIYVILAVVLTKRARVDIGLSTQWFAKRQRRMLVGWGLVLLGVGLIYFGFQTVDDLDLGSPAYFLLGFSTILGGAIYGLVGARMVVATRIDDHCAWVKGVCREYLDELPPWPYGG